MKRLTFILLLFCSLTTAQAAVSPLLHYQGQFRDRQGMPLQGSHKLTFRIYDAEIQGNLLWIQIFPVVNIEEGNFVVLLDVSTADPPLTFNAPYWLSIAVDETAEMTPRQRIASTFYTMNAATVDGIQASVTPQPNNLLPLDAQGKFPPEVLDIQQGPEGNFNADMVDGFHASAAATANTILPLNQVAKFPQNVMPDDLNADTIDGKDSTYLLARPNHTGVQPPNTISPQGTGSNLNADKVDGFDSLDLMFFKNMQAFTSNGTWIKPENVTRVHVKVWGGGGHGGDGSANGCGAGGGGGGYAEGLIAVSGNAAVTIGGPGGTSSFSGNSMIQASGGGNGQSNASYGVGGSGGVGSGGMINLSGVAGGSCNVVGEGDGGGGPMGGAGGTGGRGQGSNGINGGLPGGGGGGVGGGYDGLTGGRGADGLVIVYY